MTSRAKSAAAKTNATKGSSSRFLCQDKQSVERRRVRRAVSSHRAKRGRRVPQAASSTARAAGEHLTTATRKRPAAFVDTRRPLPCCGKRRERCRCDWRDVEACLDGAAWMAFQRRLARAELKYAAASVVLQHKPS